MSGLQSSMDNASLSVESLHNKQGGMSEIISNYLFVLTVSTFILATLLRLVLSKNANKKRLPPGPRPWPIVGNLPMLGKGRPVHQILESLSQTYGPVYILWMGAIPTIVVTGEEAAREALVTQATVFSSRPQPPSWRWFSDYRTSSSSVYGPFWQKLRKNLTHHVLNPTKLLSYKPIRDSEVEKLLQKFREEANGAKAVVRPLSFVRFSMLSIFLRVCFGSDFEATEEREDMFVQLEALLDTLLKLLSVNQVSDYIPISRRFPSSKANDRRYEEVRLRAISLLLPEIQNRRSKLQDTIGSPSGSFLDTLLSLEGEDSLTDLEILWNMIEVLVAGVDTTSQAVEWALAHMVASPQVQAKAFEEIERVMKVDASRDYVPEEILETLPYVQAISKESLRMNMPAVLGLPHATSKDCKLQGYDIPAKTQVLFNLGALGKDPTLWADPLTFRPERFLETEAAIEPGQLKWVPFGGGRRICPGMHIGTLHFQLVLANLLYCFQWEPAQPGALVDFSEEFDLVLRMKTPLEASIRVRTNKLHS